MGRWPRSSGTSKSRSVKWKKVINLLKRYNIDFTVDDDKIMIVGNLKYVDIGSFPTISIWQGGNEIAFDEVVN